MDWDFFSALCVSSRLAPTDQNNNNTKEDRRVKEDDPMQVTMHSAWYGIVLLLCCWSGLLPFIGLVHTHCLSPRDPIRLRLIPAVCHSPNRLDSTRIDFNPTTIIMSFTQVQTPYKVPFITKNKVNHNTHTHTTRRIERDRRGEDRSGRRFSPFNQTQQQDTQTHQPECIIPHTLYRLLPPSLSDRVCSSVFFFFFFFVCCFVLFGVDVPNPTPLRSTRFDSTPLQPHPTHSTPLHTHTDSIPYASIVHALSCSSSLS